MNEARLWAEARGFAEAARDAESIDAYDRFVWERFDRAVGFDVAFFVRGSEPSAVAPGFEGPVRRACVGRWTAFRDELDLFAARALAAKGIGVDRTFFGAAGLERKNFYQEIMRPHHGRSTLLAYLARRGRVEATLVLGRKHGTRDFTDRDQHVVEALLPTMTLCEIALGASFSGRPGDALGALTPREREVMDYLTLGYTNAEIALGCGTSPATVRNQLSSVFRKIGASTRAEAVALALRPRRP